jgi:hypothetical protein
MRITPSHIESLPECLRRWFGFKSPCHILLTNSRFFGKGMFRYEVKMEVK